MIDGNNPLLNVIGNLLAEDREFPLDNTLLYAQVGEGYVSPSIYKNLGNHIVYRRPDLDRLGDALLDLWEAQPSDDRWAAIEYVVRDGHFEATYIYPDAIDPDEFWHDRVELVVRKYFGDKPIIFPPWSPDDDDTQSFTL
jgi:hypothetical protein